MQRQGLGRRGSCSLRALDELRRRGMLVYDRGDCVRACVRARVGGWGVWVCTRPTVAQGAGVGIR